MARIRSIKPEFWTDEKVVAISPLARLLFIGMWNFVDDDGRAEYSPLRLKMQILPADSADITELLGEIRREGLIDVYTVDGKEYFVVTGFSKHQKVDKRSNSKHPPPPSPSEFPRTPPTDQGGEGIKEGKGREYSEPIGSDAPRAPAVVPIDARTALFREGLEIVRAMTGKPEAACRSLLGQWLKLASDDAGRVLTRLRQARSDNRAELVSWMEASLRTPQDDERIYRGVL